MKKIIVLAAVFLLAGCSTKFAYNNISWLVYWYIDDYVEFNKDQKIMFDDYIASWQSWHKQSELPKYQAHLEELASDIATQNISIDRMAYHQDKARDHWHRARAHVAPGLVELAKTLDEEQITFFFAALEKENVEDEEEWLERQERSEKRRKDDWIDRNFDNLEDYLGRLTTEQKDFVRNSYGNFESTRMHWIKYKRDYQQAMRQAFVMEDRGEQFENTMLELATNPEVFRSEDMLAASDRNEEKTKEFLLTVFSLSTDKQRQHFIRELNDLRDDMIDLSE
ncbi:DUF6279 family lipoprotein [Ningiella sp. W23]|uniref:DUF6279 family lipoprotein n=1 Tax=Ningiella sp. W23 TaxID=3023715 RepID=UPI0037580B3D